MSSRSLGDTLGDIQGKTGGAKLGYKPAWSLGSSHEAFVLWGGDAILAGAGLFCTQMGPGVHTHNLGGQRESVLTQEPGPNPTCLVSAKRRAATHPWTPSSFQPARPARTRPAQSRNPQVRLPPDHGGSQRPWPLGCPEATSHRGLLLTLKPKIQVQSDSPHFEHLGHRWPAAQALYGADTAHPGSRKIVSPGRGQGFSVSTPVR